MCFSFMNFRSKNIKCFMCKADFFFNNIWHGCFSTRNDRITRSIWSLALGYTERTFPLKRLAQFLRKGRKSCKSITVYEKTSEIVSFRTLAITVLEVLGISLIYGFFLIHLIPGILLRETDLKLHEKILLSRKYF